MCWFFLRHYFKFEYCLFCCFFKGNFKNIILKYLFCYIVLICFLVFFFFISLLLSSLLKIFISILFWPLLIFYTRHFLQSIVSCLLSLNFVFLLKLKFSLFSCFMSVYISPYTKLIFFITYSSFSWSSFFMKILKIVNGEIVA